MRLGSTAAAAVAVVCLLQHASVGAIFSTLGGFASAGAATSVGISAAGAAVAAGAAAVAAAGIAGLGIAAVAFKISGNKKGGYGPSYSVYQYGYHDDSYGHQDLHDHHGGYGGYGGYGHSHYRRRRSARAVPDVETDRSESMAHVFGVVATMDAYGCGLRLLCDLHASPDKALSGKEISVKRLVSPEEYVRSTHDPRYAYVVAARTGTQGYDCTRAYPACPLSKKQAKFYLNSLSI